MVFSIFNFKELKIKLIDPIRNWGFFTHTYTQRTNFHNLKEIHKKHKYSYQVSSYKIKHGKIYYKIKTSTMVDFNKDTLDLISQILLDYDLFLISKHTIPIDKEAKLIKEFFQEKYPEISS